ncbi:S-(hydroxymethyl)glutathione dehydrogenase/alcohol dehydrogenase [Rhodococcus sp. BE178]
MGLLSGQAIADGTYRIQARGESCGVPTGWGSATNIAEVKPGESVAIIGVGGVGMSALQGSVASGARHVFAIDPVPFKREQALTLTAKNGRCVVTAMGHMADMDVKLNAFLFAMLQKDLRGNIYGGCNARVDIPNLLNLYRAGRLNLADMVTNTYSLEQVNDGYQDMLDNKNIRGVVRFTEADW